MTTTSLLAVYQELRSDWSAREPAASTMGTLGRAAWSEWATEGDSFGLELPYPTWAKAVTADLVKVGPKGYIHGWIKVGAAGAVGDLVHHPEHGHGKVTRVGSKTVGVQFHSGAYHAFEHGGVGEGHFVPRGGRVAKPAAPKKNVLTAAQHKFLANLAAQPNGIAFTKDRGFTSRSHREALEQRGLLIHTDGKLQITRHGQTTAAERAGRAVAVGPDRANVDLARRVATGVDESSAVKPRQGVSAEIRRVRLGDGSTAYRKVAYSGETVNDEYLATRVAQAVGVNVPAVHRADDRTLFLEDIKGQHARDAGLSHEDTLNHPDARLIGLADALTGVQDRSTHGANHLVTPEGRITAIDNAPNPIFDESGIRLEQPRDHTGAALPVQDMRGANPFAERFIDSGSDGRGVRAKTGSELGGSGETYTIGNFRNLGQGSDLRGFDTSLVDTWRQGNDLKPEEVAAIRQRLEALRPEFDAVGRGDRLDYIKDRLDAVAAYSRHAPPAVSPRMQAEALHVEAAARQRALDAGLPAAGSTGRRHHVAAGPVGTGQGATAAGWEQRIAEQQQVDELHARAEQVATTPVSAPEVTRAAEDRILAMDRPGAPAHIRETAAGIRERRAAEAPAEPRTRITIAPRGRMPAALKPPSAPRPAATPKPPKLPPAEAAQQALSHIRAGGQTDATLKALPVAALRELARLHGIVGSLGGRDNVKRMRKPDLIREMTPWFS